MSSQSISGNQLLLQPKESGSYTQKLANELLSQRVTVQTKTVGMFGNFFTIASQKTYELYINIIGDYRYQPKNQFSYNQKSKILDYLHSKVLTVNAQQGEREKIKFSDFDPNFLEKIPEDFDQLRGKILKGRTNVQCAKLSLQKIKYSRQYLRVKYLNEEAYQFDRMRSNSLAWGLVIGALINISFYRRGNTIRKAALFVTSGYFFAILGHRFNIDRYFDSVYPIFRQEAVQFAKEQKKEFKQWKPQGKAVIQE